MHITNWKKEIFTIPNMLSVFRILLIPVYVWLYLGADRIEEHHTAALVLAVSCLTDMIDGKIARKFNMITNLGYTPTDEELAAAGMSKEHYQSYKSYYDKSQKTSSGTGGPKTKTYKTMTNEDIDYWEKKLSHAESTEDMYAYLSIIEDNFGEDVANQWGERYIGAFEDKKSSGTGIGTGIGNVVSSIWNALTK